ncbi:MAG TPA: hypothetical protein VJ779_14090 [Acetobacteraceae bacterium]|nr:hypothetical protein [Acetobacteraceae bacterium]
MPRPYLAAILAGTIALLAGCAAQPQVASMATPPPVPPPRPDPMPKPPVTATLLIWQPGHWDWNGAGYVWQPGEYVPREGHSGLYMPGYWAQTPSGWQWQPAHWM